MRRRVFPLSATAIFLVFLGCTSPGTEDALPTDPCEVVSSKEVARATGLAVVSSQLVTADVGLATCYFETKSRFGTVGVRVPFTADRSAERYWADRDRYFGTFPGSAVQVADLGQDAWLSGGTVLHVLLHGDDYFVLSTRMYQSDSREILRGLALAILERFPGEDAHA